MAYRSLADVLPETSELPDYFRSMDTKDTVYSPHLEGSFPDEYSHWIEEQRALRESAALVDQSHHMMSVHMEGPDTLPFLSNLVVNDVSALAQASTPDAKHIVMCSPSGWFIRDTVLFYLPGERFVSVGSPVGNNWLLYNVERTNYEVNVERPVYSPIGDYHPIEGGDGLPRQYRFEVQGPNALALLDAVVDGGFPNLSFFDVAEISIDGMDGFGLAHGMAGAPGAEIFGPYEHRDDIEEAILARGDAYDLRQMGSKAYKTGKIGIGWIKLPVPGIYGDEELAEYREWLGADTIEAHMAIGGSFVSDRIEDYYMTPFELGYDHHVSFDHEFIGRDVLRHRKEKNSRTKVTFVWDSDDVLDVFGSLFRPGATHKFIDLPDTANRWSKTHYDEVRKNGEIVGIGKYPGYLEYERRMLTLGVIEEEFAEPGTEVTLVWGEADSKKTKVERHEPIEIRATVAPSPYSDVGRQETAAEVRSD